MRLDSSVNKEGGAKQFCSVWKEGLLAMERQIKWILQQDKLEK